ncbi:hypothetical protein EGM97_25330 [Pseudomonas sp. AF32]|uniref:hypothetical protein n=1 Tax=Pseudomonas sp. AF32 TaxID=554390 RepID=UPI001EEDEE0B|nr:hypothetical protein [Pseudomonas sp. AF32]MCG6578010.1 hypothetical protein [Pseudomonas sp. AF32]
MYIDPGTGLPYVPTPSYFLGCFDIYDREETLGVELDKFDPNDVSDREKLITNYSLKVRRSYRERFLLYKCLEEALLDDSYDFHALLKHDPEEYSSFPDGWEEMDDPRAFFADIYRLASDVWNDDIRKAEAEDRSTWNYI